jgi:hypothetical protein
MVRRLADDVNAQPTVLVVGQRAADALEDTKPNAPVKSHRRGDEDWLDKTFAPAAVLDGTYLGPGRAGQAQAFASTVASAQDFLPAIVPDREQTFGVGKVELHLALAAAVADAPLGGMTTILSGHVPM